MRLEKQIETVRAHYCRKSQQSLHEITGGGLHVHRLHRLPTLDSQRTAYPPKTGISLTFAVQQHQKEQVGIGLETSSENLRMCHYVGSSSWHVVPSFLEGSVLSFRDRWLLTLAMTKEHSWEWLFLANCFESNLFRWTTRELSALKAFPGYTCIVHTQYQRRLSGSSSCSRLQTNAEHQPTVQVSVILKIGYIICKSPMSCPVPSFYGVCTHDTVEWYRLFLSAAHEGSVVHPRKLDYAQE